MGEGMGVSGPDTLEKVLERLATTEKSTLVIERAPEGKVRVTSGSWDGEKVILKDQVLEIRNVEGRLRVAHENAGRMSGIHRLRPMNPVTRATCNAVTRTLRCYGNVTTIFSAVTKKRRGARPRGPPAPPERSHTS
jgi:hypothetical protein